MNIFLPGVFLILLFLFISVEDLVAAFFRLLKKVYKKVTRNKLRRRKRISKTIVRFAKSPRIVKIKYFLIGALFSAIFIFTPLLMTIFIQDLPSPYELSNVAQSQTTKIMDRNGVVLSEIYSNQNRTIVPLTDIPINLQHATIAIEDKNFYNHPGFDLPSIVRAFRENLQNKRIQGGSTITQQLIKSSILTPERSISRKIKELILSLWAEKVYTKKEILGMYFNQVPYGGTAWGAEAASETYFNKSVKEIDLAQSAFLAGLTAAPTTYSPYGSNIALWKKRQLEVLRRMVALNFITKQQAADAGQVELDFKAQLASRHAPHFVAYVKDLLIKKYGIETVERGGLRVVTSLDLKTEDMAEKIVHEEVSNATSLNLSNGAAVVTNPKNGDILAMVGSHDFNDPNGGKVNLAVSHRQPGSSIKIVTYSAALQNGFTPATTIDDSPVTFGAPNGTPYSPVNYDGQFHGKVSLRIALANSFNIPAVKTLNTIGLPKMISLAKQMGIQSWGTPADYGLSITLGAAEVTMLDMARVNGVLANKGMRVELNPILKITDVKGQVIEEKTVPNGEKVFDSGISYIISDILADNDARTMEFGPKSPLLIPGHFVSVKTGTTDNKRDNWTNGYTNNYTVIVWVGNNDNTPMSQDLASGITGAAPIWNRIMTELLKDSPETRQNPPSEIVQKFCLGKAEYFIKGTEDSVNCGTPNRGIKYSSTQRGL